MKPGIHPNYNQVEATCVCGNVIPTGSTKNVIKMDICSACHPFFTGTQRIVDTEGRVEKFKKRYTQSEALRKAGSKKSKQEEEPVAEAVSPDETAASGETEA